MGNGCLGVLLAAIGFVLPGCVAAPWIVLQSQDAARGPDDTASPTDVASESLSDTIAAEFREAEREASPPDVTPDATPDTTLDATLDVPADSAGDTAAALEVGDGCPSGRMRCAGECVARPSNFYGGEDNPFDSVGTQHGRSFNGVSYADGRFGRAFVFGGPTTMQYVELPTTVGSFGIGDFTIEFWSNSLRGGNVLAKRNSCWGGDYRGGFDVIMDTGRVASELWASSNYQLLAISELPYSVMDGRWHHVAVMRRDGVAMLYVNGVLKSERPLAGDINEPALTPIYLGVGRCVRGAPGSNGNATTAQWFEGMLDEIGFYPRAMSVSELTERAQGRCRF